MVNLVHYLLFAASFFTVMNNDFQKWQNKKNKTVNIYNSKSIVFSTWLLKWSDGLRAAWSCGLGTTAVVAPAPAGRATPPLQLIYIKLPALRFIVNLVVLLDVMVRSQNECCNQHCNYALYNNAYVNVAAEHQRKNSRMTHYTWWCLPEPAARCEFQLSLYCPTCYYSATGRGAEYCDECVCLSVCVCVCLSIRDHIFGSARPIFTKYFVHATYGRDSVLLWRHIDALCTSGFMDDVIFAHKPQT